MRTLLMLLALMMSASMLIAGCTNSQVQPQSATSAGSETGTGTTPAESSAKKFDAQADNRTAAEKTQATLAAVADGMYTDDVTYQYHSGQERITVSVTVKDDVVTAASITPHSPNKVSAKYIERVNAAIPELVIGKKIGELDLPKQISGSSLTAGAFRGYIERLVEEH